MSGAVNGEAANGEAAVLEAAVLEAGREPPVLTWEDRVDRIDQRLFNVEGIVRDVHAMLTESTRFRRQLLGLLRYGLDRACEIGKLLVERFTDPSPRFLLLLLFLLIAAGAITAGTVTDVFGAFKGLKITVGDEAPTEALALEPETEALEPETLEASGVGPSPPPASDPPDAPLDPVLDPEPR